MTDYDKVLKYFNKIRSQNSSIIRELKKTKERLEFLEMLALNVPEFNEAFEKIESIQDDDIIKLNKIINIVCKYRNVNKQVILLSNTRKAGIVYIRQQIHYLCKKYTKLNHGVIGLRVGVKNHVTVFYSDNKIKDYLTYDKELISDMEEMEKQIVDALKVKNFKMVDYD